MADSQDDLRQRAMLCISQAIVTNDDRAVQSLRARAQELLDLARSLEAAPSPSGALR